MNNAETVIGQFKWFYDKGYITNRDGNAAFRIKGGYVVTASGVDKADLQANDFIAVYENGLVGKSAAGMQVPGKPSIETAAHLAALNQSGKNASIHVHSPNTVALAALFEPFGGFKPQSHNLIEVLNTKWPELFRYTKVGHIVHFLEPGSKKLHDSIISSLGKWVWDPNKNEEVKDFNDICIMQRHGVLAIGNTLAEAKEHIVRLEHISTILLKIVTASGNLESIL